MIRHILALIWRRKRSGTIILVEIGVCFLVLCVLFTIGLYGWENWRRPAGFDHRNVWLLEIGNQPRPGDSAREDRITAAERRWQLTEAVRAMPEVESAAWHANVPFADRSIVTTARRDAARSLSSARRRRPRPAISCDWSSWGGDGSTGGTRRARRNRSSSAAGSRA